MMTPSIDETKIAIAILRAATEGSSDRQMYHQWLDGTVEQAMGNAPLIDWLRAENDAGADIYYSTARFSGDLTSSRGRTQANAVYRDRFYLDIDNKDQPNKTLHESSAALFDFVIKSGIPCFNRLISTGNGIHAYWILDAPVDVQTWQSVANALKAATRAFGLRCDHSCTADAARVLRLPGFVNQKGGEIAQIIGDYWQTPVTLNEMSASLVKYIDAAPSKPFDNTGGMALPFNIPASNSTAPSAFSDAVTEATAPKVYPITSWDVLRKNLDAGECPLIAEASKVQSTTKYNLWSGLLSIAACTDNVPAAIEHLTSGHPNYDAHAALTKAHSFGGPRKCANLAVDAEDSGITTSPCSGCKHRATITSPIQLGKTELDQPVVVAVSTTEGETVHVELDALPHPYRRGRVRPGFPQGGGIVQVVTVTDENGEEQEREEFLMREDLRLIGVSEIGDTPGSEEVTYKFEYLHARQGFRRMILSAADMSSSKGDALGGALANALIDLTDNSLQWRARVSKFLQSLVTHHGDTKTITQTVSKFGPQHDADDSFVLGQWAYKADGTKEQVILTEQADYLANSMPSPPRTPAEHTLRAGLINDWNNQLKEVLPHDTLHAVDRFVLCSGFATALAPFITPSRVRGGMIVVNYNGSGSGKSSMVERATHIYTAGDAKFITPDGTHMSFLENRVQVGNALPMSFDEMCKEDEKGAEQLYNMALCSSNRKQRERLTSTSRGTWNTWIYATMNPDPHTLLGSRGLAADGALHRVLSIKTDPARFGTGASLIAAQSKAHKLERWGQRNGGHVGTAWIEYIMPRLGDLALRYEHWQSRFQQEMPEVFKGSGERFAVAICVTTMVAAEAARDAGLHPFNVEGLFAYAQMALKRSLNIITDNTVADVELFSELLSSSLEVTLIRSDSPFGPGDKLPNRRIGVRVETEAGRPTTVMISKPYIKEWAVKNRIDANRVMTAIMAMPGTSSGRVTMTKGTALPTLQANCIVISQFGLDALSDQTALANTLAELTS